MTCDWVAPRVHAYIDDQLEPDEVRRVNEHMRGCGACSALYERQRAMNSAVRQHGHYYTAPKHLTRSLRSNLRTLAEAERPRRLSAWGWFASGAASACAVALAVNLTLVSHVPPPATSAPSLGRGASSMPDELISAHVRSLMLDHLTDVASSEGHTVKPWFNGKVDLAPPVVDLVADGYPLIGGRLDYIDRRPVAALVYKRRQHAINMFVFPGVSRDPPQALTRLGYNLVSWADGGLSFWATSDLNLAELQAFSKLIAAKTPRIE
jgi:anti-sigma factor RsiW